MPAKKYVVREGFNFRMKDDKNNEKIFHEGDTMSLDSDFGDAQHQLEYADKSDRDAATKSEARAQKAVEVIPGVTAPAAIDHEALAAAISTGIAQALPGAASPAAIDHEALATAISTGIAQAFEKMQAQPGDAPAGDQKGG